MIGLLKMGTKKRIRWEVKDASGIQDGCWWWRWRSKVSVCHSWPPGWLRSTRRTLVPGWLAFAGMKGWQPQESHTQWVALHFRYPVWVFSVTRLLGLWTSSLIDSRLGNPPDIFDTFLFCISKSNLLPAQSLLKSVVNNSIHELAFQPSHHCRGPYLVPPALGSGAAADFWSCYWPTLSPWARCSL